MRFFGLDASDHLIDSAHDIEDWLLDKNMVRFCDRRHPQISAEARSYIRSIVETYKPLMQTAHYRKKLNTVLRTASGLIFTLGDRDHLFGVTGFYRAYSLSNYLYSNPNIDFLSLIPSSLFDIEKQPLLSEQKDSMKSFFKKG